MKYALDFLIDHADKSFSMSERGESKLIPEILGMEGMSGVKTRHFYNNICNLDDANYLEIGPWKGSSFVSSLYKNNINSIAIDDWSEFEGPKEEFLANVEKYCPESNFSFVEKDSFKVVPSDIGSKYDSIDIYLYDGCHKYESHKRAITQFSKFLSKYSIIIIDDWRDDDQWEKVQRGTYDGLKESGLIVHKKIEIITKQELTGPSEYWNGFGLFVCEKP
jgi:hypothetical protein